MAIIPPAFQESAVVSLRAIASRTRFSRKAGTTPRAAEVTIRNRTALSLGLYAVKSRLTRLRFARRSAGSAGRSGTSAAEWKNMPTRSGYGRGALPQLAGAYWLRSVVYGARGRPGRVRTTFPQ